MYGGPFLFEEDSEDSLLSNETMDFNKQTADDNDEQEAKGSIDSKSTNFRRLFLCAPDN